MCGIAGVMSLNKRKINKKTLSAMLTALKHRGPDDSGTFYLNFHNCRCRENDNDCWIGLGFNRLSIQDLSAAGHQPMISDDERIIIAFNGEIYNTEELKYEIKNKFGEIEYKGHSDTEVVLRCYESFGVEAFKKLNGMFAIVLIDLHLQKLFIIRDKYGIIPIHILKTGSLLAWASEIKAFMEIPEFDRDISMENVSENYLFYNPIVFPYKDVINVEPGTYWVVDLNNPYNARIVPYFSINEYLSINGGLSEKEYIGEFEDLFKDCIKRQLISDVPVGVQLSGGVDSSVVAYYAAKGKMDGRLKAFSVIFPQNARYDESEYIELAVEKTNADVRYTEVDDAFFSRNFERSLYAFERVMGIQNCMGIYRFSMDASEDVTVLLSGEGADEICGGYGFSERCLNTEKIFTDEFLMGFDRQISFYENGLRMIDGFRTRDVYEENRAYVDSIKGTDSQKIAALWMKKELVSLFERQNKCTMANSVENRVPFMDDKIVRFLLNIPLEYTVHDVDGKNETKYIIKKVAEKYFGKKFAFRSKQGFGFHISTQMKYPAFQKYVDEMILPKMKQRGLINIKEFNRKYRDLTNYQNVISAWKAINIEAWMQLFVDGRKPIGGEDFI